MQSQLGAWSRVAAGAVMLALAGAASAEVTLTLTGPIQGNTHGPQSTSNPCIIAGTQCQQPDGFDFTNFVSAGNIPDYDEVSPIYTVGQLDSFGLTAFNVAIDVNTTQDAGETLELFEVFVNGVLEFVYDPDPGTNIGNIANNGNGFADWLLGVVDLSSFADDATVQFHAVWTGATDGAESFFLISTTPQIPEPGVLWLLALGLVGLGLMRRRVQA
jgi:PEP-CTERM motif